jgi:hypothetical protein
MKNKIKNFIIFSLAFIICTAVGTVSHEYGHIGAARYFGYETKLHFASMNWHGEKEDKIRNRVEEIVKANKQAIKNNEEFPDKAEYDNLINQYQKESLWIWLGGPIQTMLTGTIGLIILFFRRNQIKEFGLKIFDWIAVFLSLFWLREIANLSMGLVVEIFSPNGKIFGGDEYVISISLGLWEGTIPILFGALGLIVSVFIVFWVVPRILRLNFILSGLFGGVCGWCIWMYWLGPVLLP